MRRDHRSTDRALIVASGVASNLGLAVQLVKDLGTARRVTFAGFEWHNPSPGQRVWGVRGRTKLLVRTPNGYGWSHLAVMSASQLMSLEPPEDGYFEREDILLPRLEWQPRLTGGFRLRPPKSPE